jgi:hypothetical protein
MTRQERATDCYAADEAPDALVRQEGDVLAVGDLDLLAVADEVVLEVAQGHVVGGAQGGNLLRSADIETEDLHLRVPLEGREEEVLTGGGRGGDLEQLREDGRVDDPTRSLGSVAGQQPRIHVRDVLELELVRGRARRLDHAGPVLDAEGFGRAIAAQEGVVLVPGDGAAEDLHQEGVEADGAVGEQGVGNLAVAGQLIVDEVDLLEVRLGLVERGRLLGPARHDAAEKRGVAGVRGGDDIQGRDLATAARHRDERGTRPDDRGLRDEGHQAGDELDRHEVAARRARLGGHGGLARHVVPLDERRAHLVESLAVVVADGQEEAAEGVLGVAGAPVAEDGGGGSLAAPGLGLGEVAQGGVEAGLEVAGDARQRGVDGALDQGREHVVADGLRRAAGDERGGVGFGEVEALAGLAAEVIAGQLHEHEVAPGCRFPQAQRGGRLGVRLAALPGAVSR